MIPKIIHYCWFGRNPLPELAQKCIASWRKFLPDYEIKEWNEDNFDVNMIPYTAEAYKAKKYAFVSDYARFWILYKHGGLYFDTDVEVIKPMDDIIARGPFMGCENILEQSTSEIAVAPGLGLGASPNLPIYKEILNFYEGLIFSVSDVENFSMGTVVTITSKILNMYGLSNSDNIQNVRGINIYPPEYFCPFNYNTGLMHITSNTKSIHHYDASWLPKSRRFKDKIKRKLHPWHMDKLCSNVYHLLTLQLGYFKK